MMRHHDPLKLPASSITVYIFYMAFMFTLSQFQNKIEKMENLECLQNVRFITLANNLITHISGLGHLTKLGFLDLSENLIDRVDIGQCNMIISYCDQD